MFVTKLKAVVAVVLLLGFIATGATALSVRSASAWGDQPPATEPKVKASPRPEPELDRPGALPDLAGTWQGDDWGKVVLRRAQDGGFEGTYSSTFGKAEGRIAVRWAAASRRYEGTWSEGTYRFGRIALDAPKDGAISGAYTTDPKCEHQPGVPSLAGLRWTKKDEEKPVPARPTPQPAKTDRERMVGNWFITNDDSLRKGEMWVTTEDSILMHAKNLGLNIHHYAHRLDASKNPKQIDITVTKGNRESVGVIKGIYTLDDDELRLCLGEMGKDRPAAFPDKPKPGDVLVLQRERWGTTPPAAKNAKPEQKVLTPEEAIKQMPKENVTVQFKVAKVEAMPNPGSGFGGPTYYIYLSDGGKFTARLAKAADQFMKLGVEPVKHFTGKVVRVTGRVEPDSGKPSFQMWVRDLADIEVVKE